VHLVIAKAPVLARATIAIAGPLFRTASPCVLRTRCAKVRRNARFIPNWPHDMKLAAHASNHACTLLLVNSLQIALQKQPCRWSKSRQRDVRPAC
jgi:hypothetical protein